MLSLLVFSLNAVFLADAPYMTSHTFIHIQHDMILHFLCSENSPESNGVTTNACNSMSFFGKVNCRLSPADTRSSFTAHKLGKKYMNIKIL